MVSSPFLVDSVLSLPSSQRKHVDVIGAYALPLSVCVQCPRAFAGSTTVHLHESYMYVRFIRAFYLLLLPPLIHPCSCNFVSTFTLPRTALSVVCNFSNQSLASD